MKRPRLSILGLMGVIVLIALGFAALRNPTILGASLIFTATVAFLATAVLGAIARRGRARAIWAGVAVFGRAYLSMSYGPFPNANGVDCPPFPTQVLNDYLQESWEAAESAAIRDGLDWKIRVDSAPRGQQILPSLRPGLGNSLADWKNGRRVVHSLGAITFSLIGAVFGCALAGRGELAVETRMSSA